MSTIKDIVAVYATVKKQGNGAHVMVPKEWLGREVQVRLKIVAQREAVTKELKKHRIRNIK